MDAALPAPENRWLALLAAAWYGLHPANAETVNYLIARSEILSTLGVVAALVMFARGGVWRRYHVYLIPAVLGILGKEAAAMFAPLLLLYVVLIERDVPLRATWPAFLVCAGVVAAAISMAVTYEPGGRSA